MKILVIDDSHERHFGFSIVYVGNQITKAYNVKQAIDFIDAIDFDLIHLDHDLQDFEHFEDRRPIEHTGMEVCSYLIRKGFGGRVIIHSWNTAASLNMKKLFENAGIRVKYEPYHSFTSEQI